MNPDQCNNGINKNETLIGETIESAPKLNMSYASEEHLYIDCLEFEMHFPMKNKNDVRLQDQPTVYADYNFIVVYFSM